MDSECVVSTDGLAKAFGRRFSRKKIHALRGVTLSVHHGQIFALLGPNGAGKTTLIKILLGIIRRSAGKASLFHLPAGDRRSRQRIGYLPEQLKLPRHQTARTALEYYGRLSGMSHADIRAKRDGILDTVGLAGRDRESVRRFSKGMQQRLGLAQAMLHDPDLLILDEPTDGLDPVGRAQVRSILVGLREGGKTIFINSHLLQEVELICDQIAILDQGSLRFSGTLEELTPTHENTIGMEVLGKPSEIKAALQSCEPFDVLDEDNGITRLAIPFDDQAKIDAIVDQLRQNKLSIQRLSKQRKTLEDAFMDLIHAPRQNG